MRGARPDPKPQWLLVNEITVLSARIFCSFFLWGGASCLELVVKCLSPMEHMSLQSFVCSCHWVFDFSGGCYCVLVLRLVLFCRRCCAPHSLVFLFVSFLGILCCDISVVCETWHYCVLIFTFQKEVQVDCDILAFVFVKFDVVTCSCWVVLLLSEPL